jgi:hypothetical protein
MVIIFYAPLFSLLNHLVWTASMIYTILQYIISMTRLIFTDILHHLPDSCDWLKVRFNAMDFSSFPCQTQV